MVRLRFPRRNRQTHVRQLPGTASIRTFCAARRRHRRHLGLGASTRMQIPRRTRGGPRPTAPRRRGHGPPTRSPPPAHAGQLCAPLAVAVVECCSCRRDDPVSRTALRRQGCRLCDHGDLLRGGLDQGSAPLRSDKSDRSWAGSGRSRWIVPALSVCIG